MHKDIRLRTLIFRVRHPACLLFFFGSCGLVIGSLLAANADASCFSLMRRIQFETVSIVPSLASQLLPFLIAAYAASISQYRLIYVVSCCKLFSFAYIGSLVWMSFGTAGWLVRFLLLFQDIILIPLYCWFCFRRTMDQGDEKADLWICIFACVLTALIHCLFISPFLASIT